MAEAWPPTFPPIMLPESGQSPEGTLFTQNDIGPALSRLRTRAAPEFSSARTVFPTAALFTDFKDFWRVDLAFGSIPVLLDYDDTSVTREVRLRKYVWNNLGAGRYEVVFDAEVMPSG